MIAVEHLRFETRGGVIAPRYLLESDHVWLGVLLDAYQRFEGRRHAELVEHLRDGLAAEAPPDKLRVACSVLDRIHRTRTRSVVPPPRVRAALFGAAARIDDRAAALAEASAALGVDEDVLTGALFADLPSERVLVSPKERFGPAELALRCNLALVASFLKRAERVRIRAEGNVRALVRTAKLGGLLCTVVEGASGRGVELELSGPYALFRRTLVYGRALASVVPRAARCHFFELRARCVLDASASPKILVVRSGDPIFPAHALEPFDSKLEERFQRDFLRAAPDWDLVREPEAVPACGTLVFPDFLVQHRRHRERSWLLEIVGFWTPLYLEQKLSRLRAAGLRRFILCVDAERACAEDELPKGAHVVRFRRRVDPKAVLAIVEASEEQRGEE